MCKIFSGHNITVDINIRYFLLQDAENRQKVPMVAEVTMDDDFVDSSDEDMMVEDDLYHDEDEDDDDEDLGNFI